jgi:hypothetical protein
VFGAILMFHGMAELNAILNWVDDFSRPTLYSFL